MGISQRVCSSHHIAINSTLRSILFNFADIFILRIVVFCIPKLPGWLLLRLVFLVYLKVFQSLVFLLCKILTFGVYIFKNVFKSRT